MLLDPRISACIVLYHSGEKALDAVRCIQASTVPVDLRIIDHSPQDPTAGQIHEIAPNVPIYPQKENLGYARGHNLMLPMIHSAYHLVMNPDVVFAPDLLERMMAYMDAHPDIMVLTPRVFGEDGEEQFLPKLQPTLRYLLGGVLENRLKCARRWRDEYTLRGQEPDGPLSVQFATGCFMLVRTHLFFRLKGFDERFFLYHEDSDFSRRVLLHGSIVYNPDFCITHTWGRESHKIRKMRWEHFKSTVKYFHKWGWRW